MEETTPQNSQSLKTLQTSIFFVSQPFFILGLLLPIYGKGVGANAFEIGLIFSALSVVTIIMRPIVGLALDKFGRRLFYVTGILGYALTMVGFAYSGSVWNFIGARLLQGTASAFAMLSASAIIADLTTENNRAQAFGKFAQASSRGSILGALIAFSLYNTPSFGESTSDIDPQRILFLVFAGSALIAFVIAASKLPETKQQKTISEQQPIIWSRPWLLLILVALVTAAAWAMTSPILILFLQEKLNARVDLIAWAFLPSGLIWATMPSKLGRLADRFGRKPLMVLGLVVSAFTMFVLPSITNIIWLAILWSLLALCFAAGDPAEQALAAELTGGDQHGRAYGFYVMSSDIGAALGPLGGGWLYEVVSVSAPFFATGIVLGFCGFIILFLLQLPRLHKGTEQ
jgi:MFS family permease